MDVVRLLNKYLNSNIMTAEDGILMTKRFYKPLSYTDKLSLSISVYTLWSSHALDNRERFPFVSTDGFQKCKLAFCLKSELIHQWTIKTTYLMLGTSQDLGREPDICNNSIESAISLQISRNLQTLLMHGFVYQVHQSQNLINW
jgi:hypothetical protein